MKRTESHSSAQVLKKTQPEDYFDLTAHRSGEPLAVAGNLPSTGTGRRFYYCHPPPSALYSWTKLRYSSPRAAASVSSAP
jgi:hypothetical protein